MDLLYRIFFQFPLCSRITGVRSALHDRREATVVRQSDAALHLIGEHMQRLARDMEHHQRKETLLHRNALTALREGNRTRASELLRQERGARTVLLRLTAQHRMLEHAQAMIVQQTSQVQTLNTLQQVGMLMRDSSMVLGERDVEQISSTIEDSQESAHNIFSSIQSMISQFNQNALANQSAADASQALEEELFGDGSGGGAGGSGGGMQAELDALQAELDTLDGRADTTAQLPSAPVAEPEAPETPHAAPPAKTGLMATK